MAISGSERPQARPAWLAAWIAGLGLIVGGMLRYDLLGHLNGDAHTYLTPWFEYAAARGWRALDTGFTNYTPVYSYLLIASTPLKALLPPMTIIKGISFVFELANAALLSTLVRSAGGGAWRAALAFVAAWIAPTVLFNGAAWGQADSIWACFDLLAILMFVRGREGTLPFAIACAVKAQGVFLGPFVLAMALRRRRTLWLILALPVAYLVLAAPVLLAGRPLDEVLMVYVEQGQTFRSLSMHAASLWWLLRGLVGYDAGVLAGMALAAAAGVLIALVTWRSPRTDPLFLMVSAACALLLMPYLLPKMHDRYFYGFELLSIALACLRGRYLVPAIAAQLSGVLAYLAFEFGIETGLAPAAILNGAVGIFMLTELIRLSGLFPPRPVLAVQPAAIS